MTGAHGPHIDPHALPDRLPSRCLVGPDGVTVADIRQAASILDDEVVAVYAHGLAVIAEICRLAALEAQCAEWRQQRAFALARLRTLERHHPQLVARVLLEGGD